jgi:hypothetical protein
MLTDSENGHFFSKHRFSLLFFCLLTILVLYPYLREGTFSYLAFRMLAGAGILLTVYVFNLRRTVLIIAFLLAIPAMLERMLIFHKEASSFSIFGTALSFVFDVFAVVIIFRRVFSKSEAEAETIFGALCIYLLVGFSFAGAYGLVAALQPHAFYLNPLTNLHGVPDRFDFVYYSFSTITSLGAAGIIPVSSQARSLSVIEAILGILYLAVLIARLVSGYKRQS